MDLLFDGIGPALQHLRADRLRALAVAGPARLNAIPAVATTAEAGLPKVSMSLRLSVVASAAVPRSILAQFHDEVARAIAQPRLSGRFTDLGFQPMTMTADEFGAFIRHEAERSAALVHENRIVLE